MYRALSNDGYHSSHVNHVVFKGSLKIFFYRLVLNVELDITSRSNCDIITQNTPRYTDFDVLMKAAILLAIEEWNSNCTCQDTIKRIKSKLSKCEPCILRCYFFLIPIIFLSA